MPMRVATTLAIGAEITPSGGKPNDPRISAGVSAIESAVVPMSATNGDCESPTPRKNIVYAR
jgi:hypothetical protein